MTNSPEITAFFNLITALDKNETITNQTYHQKYYQQNKDKYKKRNASNYQKNKENWNTYHETRKQKIMDMRPAIIFG